MKKIIFSALILNFLCFYNAQSTSVDIRDVIKEVLQNSKSKKSGEYELEASKKEVEKSKKHWLPQLYIDHSSYKTNDPTQNFMSNLYQRSISQSDFNPNSLNKVANTNFSKSSFGLNWPLYQGKSGIYSEKMANDMALYSKYKLNQIEIEQYSEIVAKYVAIVSLAKQKDKLELIKNDIEQVIERYSLRNKKNQIGYSGFLSLKSSLNMVKSFITDNKEKTDALYKVIQQIGFKRSEDWQVEYLPLENYLDKYLNIASNDESFESLSIKARSEASKKEQIISNANNLPKISLFAENYLFNGSRSLENGYVAGLNLRWNFFDPFSYNNKSIAQDKANSNHFQYLAFLEKEKAEVEYLNAQISSAKNSIELLKENEKLMIENISVSKNLFNSGSITAANLSDSFMQYLDNFVYLANLEVNLIELYSLKLSKQKINIDEIIAR